jgi:hypothetical protein
MGSYRTALRDPWFSGPLAALCGIIVLGSALAISGTSDASGGGGEPRTVVTPSATQAPSVAAQATAVSTSRRQDDVALDFARALDINTLRDDFALYYERHRAYPDTAGQVTTLCDAPADAACGLTEVDDDAPFGDGDEPYWYVSDGSSYYIIVAKAALVQPDVSMCPDLPVELASGPVMCMRFDQSGG